MPDTGAPWNLPYPAPSDLVRNGPAQFEALADAVADGLTEASIVKQVVSTTKTDVFTASVAQGARSGDVTGLTVSITPTSTTTKVLVVAQLTLSNLAGSEAVGATLFRDGTAVLQGDAEGSRQLVSVASQDGTGRGGASATISFLDSPATTSAVVYSVRLSHSVGGTATVALNRSQDDSNTSRQMRSTSTITAIEVAA
jgi:hypothetical protein